METEKKRINPKYLIASVICLVLLILMNKLVSDVTIRDYFHIMSSAKDFSNDRWSWNERQEWVKKHANSKNFSLLLEQHLGELIDRQEYERLYWLLDKLDRVGCDIDELDLSGFDQMIAQELEELATARDYDSIGSFLRQLNKGGYSIADLDLTKFDQMIVQELEELATARDYDSIGSFLYQLNRGGYSIADLDLTKFDQMIVQELEEMVTVRDYDSIGSFLRQLDEGGYAIADLDLTKFDQLLIEGLESSLDEWSKGMDLLYNLDMVEYHSENLKNGVASWLKEVIAYVFSMNASEVDFYIEQVKRYENRKNYTSIINCFPYQEMKACIESNGTKAITEDNAGGYYDSLKNEYEDEDYWYDPLSNRKSGSGSVGEYHYELSHEFYGDFMWVRSSRYWYGTSDDSMYSSYVKYMGQSLGDTDRIDWYYILMEADNVYILRDDDEIVLFVIEDAQIIIVSDGEMVTVAYE